MNDFRMGLLKERADKIKPDLTRARKTVETAEAEHRELTPDERAFVDPVVKEAREIADGMRVRDEDALMTSIAGEFGDVLGTSLTEAKSRRLSFKGMGAGVARQMLPDGMKASAPSGGAVVGQEMKPDPVALGQPALSLLDVIPVTAHAQPEFAYMRQTVRTNLAAVVAEGLTKPTSMLSVTRIEQSLAVVRTSRRASRGIGCSTPAPWRRRARSPGLLGQLADTGAQGRPGGGCPVCLGSFSPAMLHARCCG